MLQYNLHLHLWLECFSVIMNFDACVSLKFNWDDAFFFFSLKVDFNASVYLVLTWILLSQLQPLMLPFSLSKSTLMLHYLWCFMTWMLLYQLWYWCFPCFVFYSILFYALSKLTLMFLSPVWLECMCLKFDFDASLWRSNLTLMVVCKSSFGFNASVSCSIRILLSHSFYLDASLSNLTLMLHYQTWPWCFPVTFYLDASVSYIYKHVYIFWLECFNLILDYIASISS